MKLKVSLVASKLVKSVSDRERHKEETKILIEWSRNLLRNTQYEETTTERKKEEHGQCLL